MKRMLGIGAVTAALLACQPASLLDGTSESLDGRSGISSGSLSVEPRPGVTVKVRLFDAASPVAIAVLFMGGSGKLEQHTNTRGFPGFLAGSAERFAAHGLITALVDAPSDRQGPEGMSLEFRIGPDHAADTDAVIARLKLGADLPVWVVGVSLGTVSATNAAVNGRHPIDGVILASSSLAITRMKLANVTVPALMVAHENDGCRGTPPRGAREIAQALTGASVAEVEFFSGGRTEGLNPCHPGTPHTFHGIQERVVAFIADFIKAHSN
ncbi:MAG: hypothetical protein QF902_12145 [Rhodospirillales bacterium]|nr:hypothetical protein [Rhodospirillales bacterium]